ncbi:MFS general substrate transporter [Clavulina sp. PMI_390]|nr:MFS general substrate transporter [Clavulina sp. PMI_390]
MSLATRTASHPLAAHSDSEDLESQNLLSPVLENNINSSPNQITTPRVRVMTPLPLPSLLILLLVRIAEPINLTQVFPYVNQMIEDLRITTPEDVGYYSGLVDSCFSLAELVTVYYWSSLSDRVGRKPVVILGVSGAALSAACFGLSSSLPAMLISRSIAGGLSGNAAVVTSMVSEMTDETNQGVAFTLLGSTWWIGCILGPMIGGSFSSPMTKWPQTFKLLPIFQTYPYFLPCLISSILSTASAITCGLFVEESSEAGSSHGPPIAARLENTTVNNGHEAQPPGRNGSVLALLSKAHIRAVIIATFLFSLVSVGFEVVFPLYSYTPVDLGGMGLNPTQIGWILSMSGIVGIASLIVFPYIQHRFNNRHLYAFFATLTPITFALMPIGNLAARWTHGTNDGWLWVAIAIILIPTRMAVNLYPLTMIIVKSSVDDPSQLGSIFGLQQTTSAVARGIAPYFVSSLFAFSVDRDILGGNLVWVVMVAFGVGGVWISTKVKDVEAPQRLLAMDPESEDEEVISPR